MTALDTAVGRPGWYTVEDCRLEDLRAHAFPTDLDRDQPIRGLAPETQAELLWRALRAEWPADTLADELTAQAVRHGAR
jgi:hypothetical protein